MAYTPYMWVTGDPITQEKMRHIEDGITDAANVADSAFNQSVEAKSLAQENKSKINLVETTANKAIIDASQAMTATTDGANAWRQIVPLMQFDPDTHGILVSLQGYLRNMQETLENSIGATDAIARDAAEKALLANTEVGTARNTFTTLDDRLDSIDNTVSLIQSAATQINEVYNQAKGNYNSLALRLTAIDGNPTLATVVEGGRVGVLEAEINAARSTYANLNLRLNAIEASAGTIDSNTVKYTDVKNNLTSVDIDKPLSAAMGKELKDTIGGTYSSANTVSAGITSAAGNAETNAKNYTDSLLGTGFNTTDTVAATINELETSLSSRIDAIDNAETGTVHGLDERISALETEVDMTSANSRIDLISNEVTAARTSTVADNTYDSLDARLEAIETTAASTNNNINIIAEELSMINNDTITNNSTRIDSLETNLQTVNTTTNARIDSLEDTITDTETGLAATKAIADAAATASDLSNLADRVSTLESEPKSATVVITKDCVTYDSSTGLPTIYTSSSKTTAITPTEDADYLLQDEEDKYYYWKYIGTAPNGTWELISGGSGSGSSSGEFAASLEAITNPDENIDYFVGNNNIGYIHYRYLPPAQGEQNGTFVRILPKGLLTNASVNSNGKPIITTLEDANTNVLGSFNALKSVNCVTTYDTDGSTPKSYALSFTDINGQEYAWDLAAGGGGSSYSVQFINDTGDFELYVPNSAISATLSAHVLAKQGQTNLSQTATITVKYKLAAAAEYSIARVISNVTNASVVDIDVIDLLAQDAITNIQLTAEITPEDTPITRNLNFTIHRVPMSIEAYNYNPASIKTSNFNFQYYCIGSNLEKVVHFVIDGVDTTENVGIPANTDLLTKQITVGSLARGMHSLRVYFTVGSYPSNEINTYFLYDDGTQENKPIIALSTDKSTIQDGEELNLNYTVYTKGKESTENITLETYTLADNVRTVYETKAYENVSNGVAHRIAITNYPSSGTFYLTMTATHTANGVEYIDTKTISIVITEYVSDYDSQMVRAGTANLIYEYSAFGRTNNDSDKENFQYNFTSVSGASQTFNGTNTGFNWASNGYTDGTSLLISGGAVHTIDVPLFLSSTNNISLENDTEIDDILKNGRTFEIDYEVNSATDLNAVIASFGNGLKITPSVSYLVPQTTTVTVNSHGLIEKEDEICAAYLATGKRMHMVFVIEPKSTTPTSQGEYHQCVNIYINGEFVNSCPYALSDNFSTNSTFTIGSNTCIINLYSVRMYNRGLSNDDVLRNYMMAPNTKRDRINRFAANDVLDNNKLVDYNKARNKFNCLLITGEISPYKKSTKTPSGVTLTKPDLENLTYTTEFDLLDKKSNGTYYSSNNVQGTSSQTYPIHNLKVYLAEEDIDSVTGDPVSKKVKYSLKGANGIGESTLCWKADYMSTDHANTYNANFANDLFVDKLPSQVADAKVQNTVYGIRCLLFQRNDENSTPVFIADGCLNNDKGNNNAFGLSIKNESINDTTRQKWEFTNNSSALDFFQADGLLATSNDDYYAKTAFESTFPDEGDLEDEGLQPNYNHLQIMMTWVHQRANFWDADDTPTGTVTYDQGTNTYTTTGTVYTYNGIPYSNMREYKKAIFKNEFELHFNLNHALTYHLFSEFIALCDNRAKNMFMRSDDVRSEIVKDMSGNTIFNGNENANASFFTNTTNIGTAEDPIYALSNADQIDWQSGENHSNFAIWYPVLYDLDSCYGAENVGRITIAYDADWNYSYNNKKQFSGVDSRLWLMVEEAFSAELKTLAQTLYPNSLNYNTFYNTQVQAMLDSTCPAVTNQDMLLKFNAYWADGFIDYSLPNNPHVYRDYKYIQRGTRAYQKDTFIKLRSNYLSSKYVTSNFMNDQIKFRSSVIVPISNSSITVTTNQTLYPAITYGDNKAAIRSANKIGPGESVTLYASDQVGNTDTIHIGGASALTDIGDISKFEPYNLDVSGGINLKNLIIGSNVINTSTNKIMGLGSCTLLETINVRNCTNFSGTLDLSGNGLIKNVYASGSGITSIELREGGNLTNIEYGAQTQTIKIINHGGLQSFVYEDSANNHYKKVTKLHIENTPNVPVVDIINNATKGLEGGIRLVGLDIDLFKNASTEEEIQAALDKTTLFLNTLASDLVFGKYINSSGVFVANNPNPPYITGKVHITAIRTSLLNKLQEYYPNLVIYTTIAGDGTIDVNTITEYTINYYNYGYSPSASAEANAAQLLYTDYRTGNEHYIDPVYDTNPITGFEYIPMPTKPEDEQNRYLFGTYNNNNEYVRYSGWKKYGADTNPRAADFVSGNTIFVAQYPTVITQTYTITWYDTDNSVIYSMPSVPYGQDISSIAPETFTSGMTGYFEKAKFSNNIYKVFKGWSRPVGVITGNTNIYAQWEESTIDNATRGSGANGAFTAQEMANLTAADIYAISQLGSEAKIRLLEDNLIDLNPIAIQMGQDFDFTEGVTTTNLLNNANQFTFTGDIDAETKIYDGAHVGLSEIRPLATNSNWTLAIDYKFIIDTTYKNGQAGEYVLASCYKELNGNIQGFKLYLGRGNQVTDTTQPIYLAWGTDRVLVDYVIVDPNSNENKQYSHSFRNMLVLEHNATNPETLRVYSSGHSGFTYNTNIAINELTWSNNTLIDTPLILGGNYTYSGANPVIENNNNRTTGTGVVYWGKFWNEDLGELNCQRLANWTHEKEYFYLSGYDDNTGNVETSRRIINDTNLNFTAAAGFGDRYYPSNMGFDSTNNGTLAHWTYTYVRNFCNNRLYSGMPLAYQSIIRHTEIYSSGVDYQTQALIYPTTTDYIYLPSEKEISAIAPSLTSERQEALHKWPWLVASDYHILVQGSTSQVLVDTTASSIQPWLLRFNGAMVSPTARIFDIDTNPYRSGNGSWTYNGTFIQVQSGDIWITSNNVAYMYYTNNDITEQGIYVDIVTDGGGWKKADVWELRTYSDQYTNLIVAYGFEKIDDSGAFINQPTKSSPAVGNGRLLCPEFSI